MSLLLIAAAGVAPAVGDSSDQRRLRTGARLFRAMLAADVHLPDKKGGDGKLLVLVFAPRAESAAEAVEIIGAGEDGSDVRGLALRLEATASPEVAARHPAAVFIAEPPDDAALAALVRSGIAARVIVYSPYEGHVEKGVLGGLAVEAHVRPYLNRRTMEASGVELKPFFLKVAKVLE